MKKWTKSALAAMLAFSMAVPAFAADFSDMKDTKWDWAKSAVNSMADMGLIKGYEDGSFKPDNNVTNQEVLTLFARAMGASKDENDEIVEMALEKYNTTLSKYNIYAKEEVAYMLYRGVLKESELPLYLESSVKDQPMQRHDVAIVITKAMGAEASVQGTTASNLDVYTDIADIPLQSRPYVGYVTDKKIMQGMGDGTFQPKANVTRAQMAVMLQNTIGVMQPTVSVGKLVQVDTTTKIVTIKDKDGSSSFVGYTNDTVMNVAGVATQPKDIPSGIDAIFTYYNGSLRYIDTVSSIPDDTIKGTYKGHTTNASGVDKITIMSLDDSSKSTSYSCAADVIIQYDGTPGTMRLFNTNDTVELEISSGKVTKISGWPKTQTIENAEVLEIQIDPEFQMTIGHADKEYNGQTYDIDPDVSVKKNGVTSDFRSIYKGDSVTLTLTHGVITKVIATSKEKVVEGVIKGIAISATPTITVNVNGQDKVYDVPQSATIIVNGEEGTIYGLRIGDTVTLTIESQAITRISTTYSVSSTKEVKGVIDAINSSYGFINIKVTDDNGNISTQMAFTDKNVKVLTSTGQQKEFKSLKVGQEVTVTGTEKNGAFSATIIIIKAES
jgi:hypothetical protein